MAVQRRLAELKNECEKLGLSVTPVGKREAKKDFVKALQLHNLKVRYKEDAFIPSSLAFMLSMESPMLCFRLPNMPEDFQESVWDDPNWIAEEKINGCRMLVIYNEQEGIKFYSRNLSLIDYLPVEYTNIWLKNFDINSLKALGISSFILDTEVLCPVAKVDTTKKAMGGGSGVVTETNLQATTALMALNDADSLRIQQENDIHLEFHAFHLLELNGNSFEALPYHQMDQILQETITRLQSVDLNVRSITKFIEGKKTFFEKIVAAGGEGVVLKSLNSTYHAKESRYHKEWIKAKRTVSFSAADGGLGDTIDGWIMGSMPGNKGTAFEKLVGCLQVGVWLTKADGSQVIHHIANVPNLTLAFRQENTVIGEDGVPAINPSFHNKVVEIDGQWISARARRLVHPRLIRFREDRSPETCVLTEEELTKMII